MDLGDLPKYWQLIDEAFRSVEALPSLDGHNLLTARRFDEAQVAGPRTYMGAQRYLGVARDNHEALLALLQHRGATAWAPWSLLRPIFETAFLAAWILDPEDGLERRVRGLRCEVNDYIQRGRHRAVFKVFPEAARAIEEAEQRDATHGALKIYRDEAAALGRDFERISQPVNVVDEVRKLTFAKTQPEFPPLLEATWRQLSGFEHGFAWALMSGSERRIEAEIPGGAQVLFTLSDEQFVTTAKVTGSLLITALQLLKRRHLEPAR
ncbi:hypothetical protein AWW66_03200 [Micromonospora rosaria]|uniref:Uncharacterized protein n=2 Tax=Micromonospora rosaria TaxID=47874 RepID=A0A136PY93_9ACTN|nr:hypothetical protein AWW66_03200 [Micromonospora rosaria]